MNALIILLLAVLWVSILAPGAVRGRRPRSLLSSVEAFERSMGVLASGVDSRGTTSGRQVLVVAAPSPAAAAAAKRRRTLVRRKALLQALVSGVVASGILAVALGGPFAVAFTTAVVALCGYVAILVRLRVAAERARATVRPFPLALAPGPEDGAPAAGDELLAERPVAAVGGGAL